MRQDCFCQTILWFQTLEHQPGHVQILHNLLWKQHQEKAIFVVYRLQQLWSCRNVMISLLPCWGNNKEVLGCRSHMPELTPAWADPAKRLGPGLARHNCFPSLRLKKIHRVWMCVQRKFFSVRNVTNCCKFSSFFSPLFTHPEISDDSRAVPGSSTRRRPKP